MTNEILFEVALSNHCLSNPTLREAAFVQRIKSHAESWIFCIEASHCLSGFLGPLLSCCELVYKESGWRDEQGEISAICMKLDHPPRWLDFRRIKSFLPRAPRNVEVKMCTGVEYFLRKIKFFPRGGVVETTVLWIIPRRIAPSIFHRTRTTRDRRPRNPVTTNEPLCNLEYPRAWLRTNSALANHDPICRHHHLFSQLKSINSIYKKLIYTVIII